MKPSVPGGRPVAWEDAGRQIAALLGSYSAVIVTSSDPVAAAHVALGIARAEARHRPTIVGDLVGDLTPLRSLVADEDPHGITDSFEYGVSVNKIAYQVEGNANLRVMPSGTDPAIGQDIFRSARWRTLAAGFAQAGTLLLLVARSDAPGLGELADRVDGVVLVRDADLAGAPSALVLGRVPGPTPTLKIPLHVISAHAADWRKHKWLYAAAAGVALLVVAGLGLAIMVGRSARSSGSSAVRSTKLSQRAAAPVVVTAIPAPVPPPARPPPETLYIAPPANVDDSGAASAFAVELLVANTAEGANLFVRKNGAALPAAAVSPVSFDPERTIWYKVTAGAYTRRYQADSLLLALRQSNVLTDSAGSVVRAPLALLVDSVPTQGGIADAVRAAVQKYVDRGLAVYALMQNDGGARIYGGAFGAADQSAGLIRAFRRAGLNPVLVYRTGSTP